jgi:hypothetical protein
LISNCSIVLLSYRLRQPLGISLQLWRNSRANRLEGGSGLWLRLLVENIYDTFGGIDNADWRVMIRDTVTVLARPIMTRKFTWCGGGCLW